jgi:Zn-dependent peptidase ImmA (M78 family)/transcriptional regulator with XRE-family HTH domain
MATQYVPVTGAVVDWALRDSGLSREDAADKLHVSGEMIRAWIDETSEPTKSHFKALAKLVGRPTSFFFLPEPPRTPPVYANFRTFAGSRIEPGQETVQGIRLAGRVQKTAAWVHERMHKKPLEIPKLDVSSPVEPAAAMLRDWLGWSVEEQTGRESTDARASKALRGALEELGILVLNLTLDEGITRGFSLHHATAPVVAVNTRDTHRARLFSYAHELVHLSLGSDSVCSTRANAGIERFCNKVAAALLMPLTEFRNYVNKVTDGRKVSTLGQVTTIRNHFRVSLRAVAIRAEDLSLATSGLYNLVDREAEPKSRGGRYVPGNERTKPRIRVDQYGHRFVNTLIDAEEAGVLRTPQLLQLLQVSSSELASVRALAASGEDA